MHTSLPVDYIGLPYHFGRPPEPTGYQFAQTPYVLLAESAVPGLLEKEVSDSRIVMITDADEPDDRDHGGDVRLFPPGEQGGRQLAQNRRLSERISEAISSGRFPVVAAGNCISSLGAVAGIDDDEIGMIWFDCHADAQTPETTANAMMDGYPVSIIAGQCFEAYRNNIPGFHVIPEDRIISIGNQEVYSPRARDRKHGRPLGQVIDPPVIDEKGYLPALEEALDKLRERCSKVYVHVDTDVIDSRIYASSWHAAEGGLTPDELIASVEQIGAMFEIAAINFTAFDPAVDPDAPEVLIPMAAKVASAAITSRSARIATETMGDDLQSQETRA